MRKKWLVHQTNGTTSYIEGYVQSIDDKWHAFNPDWKQTKVWDAEEVVKVEQIESIGQYVLSMFKESVE